MSPEWWTNGLEAVASISARYSVRGIWGLPRNDPIRGFWGLLTSRSKAQPPSRCQWGLSGALKGATTYLLITRVRRWGRRHTVWGTVRRATKALSSYGAMSTRRSVRHDNSRLSNTLFDLHAPEVCGRSAAKSERREGSRARALPSRRRSTHLGGLPITSPEFDRPWRGHFVRRPALEDGDDHLDSAVRGATRITMPSWS